MQPSADASTADVGDLIAFLFVMGCRISGTLNGVSWADTDLSAESVVIRGTMTKNTVRTATLPTWLAERLLARAATYGTAGHAFGLTRYSHKIGSPRDLANILETLRAVPDDAGCPWAGSHIFRRTVATMLAEAGSGVRAIATQLGHDPTTTMSYVRTEQVGEAAALTPDAAW